MVNYLEEGDIFEIKDVFSFAHGCNCTGAMGKGIALQFKKKFPEMYLEYKTLCKKGEFSLGDVHVYNYGNGFVFNLGTQKSWRTNANLNALEESLEKMFKFAIDHEVEKIALPKIGAGLGGLYWEDVKIKISKLSNKYCDVTLFVVENYIKYPPLPLV